MTAHPAIATALAVRGLLPLSCACCGRDDLHRSDMYTHDYPPEHVAAMADFYGGSCCFTCTDEHVSCRLCDALVSIDAAERVCVGTFECARYEGCKA